MLVLLSVASLSSAAEQATMDTISAAMHQKPLLLPCHHLVIHVILIIVLLAVVGLQLRVGQERLCAQRILALVLHIRVVKPVLHPITPPAHGQNMK
jgi:hypothetical protein